MNVETLALIFSFISTLISLYVWADHTYKKRLKNKILFLILEYYSPTYTYNLLPTTKEIYKKIGLKFNRKRDIVSCLLELQNENKISSIIELDTTFDDIRWKPELVKKWTRITV